MRRTVGTKAAAPLLKDFAECSVSTGVKTKPHSAQTETPHHPLDPPSGLAPLPGSPAKHWEPVCVEFALMVREMRECEHWTQADLAERAGLCREMIRKVEALQGLPTLDSAKRLCGAFHVRLGPTFTEAERRCGEIRAKDRQS